MRRKTSLAALFLCLCLTMTVTVSADAGPKPSVQMEFSGLEEGTVCYGTLLSEQRSTGPHSAWDGVSAKWLPYDTENTEEREEALSIWEAFQSYEDPDGFYFLQEWWDCGSTGSLHWSYYPPRTFKLLLYFPETDTYRVGPVQERYAFHSMYNVDLSAEELLPERDYHIGPELAALLFRAALTLLVELLLALVMGWREKRQLGLLAVVNLITQLGLNVALQLVGYFEGGMMVMLLYLPLELLVFLVEAVVYVRLMPRYSTGPQRSGKLVLYAFLANLASFGLGFWLSLHLPLFF